MQLLLLNVTFQFHLTSILLTSPEDRNIYTSQKTNHPFLTWFNIYFCNSPLLLTPKTAFNWQTPQLMWTLICTRQVGVTLTTTMLGKSMYDCLQQASFYLQSRDRQHALILLTESYLQSFLLLLSQRTGQRM